MKPKRNSLTDAELQGELSDVDLDVSDDELDLVSNRNEHAAPTSPVAPGNDRSAGGVTRGFGCYALELVLANVS